MNRRLILAILLAGLLAYVLRDFIEETFIQPLLYMVWILRLYYEAFPQAFLWIILVVAVILMEASSLASDLTPLRKRMVVGKPAVGPVESLAAWLTRAPHGLYFKWLIAHRLGRLSRALVAFRSRQEASPAWEPLAGPGWDPPGEVAAYLQSGLNGSFADYPRPRWPFQKQSPTPLDIDPAKAIDYIESKMEKA